MEPIAKTLSTYKPASSQTLAREQSLPTIQALFDRLMGQFGGRLADLWHGAVKDHTPLDGVPNTVEREWMVGLAGFRKEELQRGLAACSDFATRGHAPTLPEFKQLCRPCLNPELAFWEAGDCLRERDRGEIGSWTHPAVFFAACTLSPEVRSGDWAKARTRWTRELHKELALGWRTVPPPAMRVEHNPQIHPLSDQQRQLNGRLSREIRAEIAAKKKRDEERAEREAQAEKLRREAMGIVDAERKP